MDLYAVFGNPIAHSKSPLIHAQFAEQTAQDLEYVAIQAPLDAFEKEIRDFFAGGAKGANITVPFKEQAWNMVDKLTERAELAGAVNTLYLDESSRLWGDNTDGIGMVKDITENCGVAITGKRVLVLGAGGAVKGVLKPLLDKLPGQLVIANRTHDKAAKLAEQFSVFGPITATGLSELDEPFDLIVNGTSASLGGQLPDLPESIISNTSVTYDMMYSAQQTTFNQWAESLGAAKTIDGLGMLIEQAAEAFRIWRGVSPDSRSAMDYVRSL